VELDPAVLNLAQEYFPAAWAALRADQRVHVHNTDGRLFLRTTNLRFDVLIVNLPEPQTAQLNRFYTLEFFREAANKLTPTGVFSFQLKASEDYIKLGPGRIPPLHRQNPAAGLSGSPPPFPATQFIFLLRLERESLTNDSQELIARLRARHITTSYVREYYLPYRMMPDRMLDLESQIRPDADTRTNRDFTPIAYYFDVALWSTRFNGAYRRVFQTMAAVRFGPLATWLALVLFGLVALLRWLPATEKSLASQRGFLASPRWGLL